MRTGKDAANLLGFFVGLIIALILFLLLGTANSGEMVRVKSTSPYPVYINGMEIGGYMTVPSGKADLVIQSSKAPVSNTIDIGSDVTCVEIRYRISAEVNPTIFGNISNFSEKYDIYYHVKNPSGPGIIRVLWNTVTVFLGPC